MFSAIRPELAFLDSVGLIMAPGVWLSVAAANLKEGFSPRVIGAAICFICLVPALQWAWERQAAERPLFLLTPIFAWCAYWLAKRKSIWVQAPLWIVIGPITFFQGPLIVMSTILLPYHRADMHRTTSPDGRYEAVVVSDDGFWQLELRAKRMDLHNFLDWPTTIPPQPFGEVLQAQWQSSNRLQVHIKMTGEATTTTWNGIRMDFVPDVE